MFVLAGTRLWVSLAVTFLHINERALPHAYVLGGKSPKFHKVLL